MERKAYRSDVSDDEWASVAPYLTLMTEEAPRRSHHLREVFNGLRWIARVEAPWRMMPKTCRRGQRCINRSNAGCALACSRSWCLTGA